VLGGEEQVVVTLPAVNRRGRQFQCRVTLTPLGDGEDARGVILMMEVEEGP
jgi:hypothetical protein